MLTFERPHCRLGGATLGQRQGWQSLLCVKADHSTNMCIAVFDVNAGSVCCVNLKSQSSSSSASGLHSCQEHCVAEYLLLG